MSVQDAEVTSSAEALAQMAEALKAVVARFRLEGGKAGAPAALPAPGAGHRAGGARDEA